MVVGSEGNYQDFSISYRRSISSINTPELIEKFHDSLFGRKAVTP